MLIFWDYDGTLVNTELTYKDSLISYFNINKYSDKKITDEYFYKNIAGNHPEEFLDKLEKDGYLKSSADIKPEDIKKYYTKYFSELKKGEIKITKDIDKLIEKLQARDDIIMCITSSSFRHDFKVKNDNVNNKILNKVFDIDKNVYLCGGIENCKFKPNPDVFVYAYNDLNKKYNIPDSEEIFIIEDSIAGCQAGKNFKEILKGKRKVNIVGYLGCSIFDNSDSLIKNGADFIAKNAEELFKILV